MKLGDLALSLLSKRDSYIIYLGEALTAVSGQVVVIRNHEHPVLLDIAAANSFLAIGVYLLYETVVKSPHENCQVRLSVLVGHASLVLVPCQKVCALQKVEQIASHLWEIFAMKIFVFMSICALLY
jgi:hypothetical protein